MKALVLNVGSSSIKFQLLNLATLEAEIIGKAVGIEGHKAGEIKIHLKRNGINSDMNRVLEKEVDAATGTTKGVSYPDVFLLIIQCLAFVFKDDFSQITVVAHRIVMSIVRSALDSLPLAKAILVFDTSFHSSLSPVKYTYSIAAPHKATVMLRKYGFNGISYFNILSQMSIHLGKPKSELNLIVAHLGAGSSICAIKRGKSVDTTMGLTPLEGLPGATRSGSIDTSLIFHLIPNASEMIPIEGGQSISRGELLLNKEAGFKGLTGTAYFAEIVKRAHSESGDASAKLCYDLFVDRIGSTISSYLSELISDAGIEGVDGIIFAGWIGERCKELRQNVVRRLNWIERLAGRDNEEIGGIDERKNSSVDEGVIQEITKSDISVLTAFVVFTNEEEEMIRLAAGKLELC